MSKKKRQLAACVSRAFKHGKVIRLNHKQVLLIDDGTIKYGKKTISLNELVNNSANIDIQQSEFLFDLNLYDLKNQQQG